MNLDNELRKENNWMTSYDCTYISPTKLRNCVFFIFFYVIRNNFLWIRASLQRESNNEE